MHIHPIYRMLIPKNPKLKGVGRTRGHRGLTPQPLLASPPTPLRMERGVVCEVTPFGLLMIGDGPLNIWRTCRGISVITPLAIRRGAGGEVSYGCWVMDVRCWWLATWASRRLLRSPFGEGLGVRLFLIGVSRRLFPSPFGEGTREGVSILSACSLCSVSSVRDSP